jgi:hypothetical protein
MNTYPLATAPLAVTSLVYPRRKIMLYGRTAAALSFRYAAEVATEQTKVTFLLGDNYFDPYAVARFARQQQRDRLKTLNSILVARGFTGYQFDEMIKRLDPSQISGPIVISGVCSAFLDDDMPNNEAARLFYRALSRLIQLAEKGVAILLTQTHEIANSRRAYFLRDLFKASDFILRLNEGNSYTLEMSRYIPISIDAPATAALSG